MMERASIRRYLKAWLLFVNMVGLHALIPRIRPNQRIRDCSLIVFSTRKSMSAGPSASTSRLQPNPQPPRRPKAAPNTGGLRRLPVVHPPNELASRARKEAFRVQPDAALRNAKQRAHKHAAQSLTALQQALCRPLRDLVDGYRSEWRRLHPFERVVADLTARARQKKDGLTLNVVLDEVHEARKMILEASKDWIAKAKSTETAREANDCLKEGTESLVALFDQFAAPPVAGMVELQRSLRTAPIVALDAPAVVLVGAPNVGKSSIVRAISSATPEVNNYPFTTRGMTLGHVTVDWSHLGDDLVRDGDEASEQLYYNDLTGGLSQQCQVMDSPGLLVRSNEEDRNEMEALTMAALQHLPTAVLYVVDLSGMAGDECSSIEDQLHLRRQVRQRFPNRPWFDVVSKVDLGVADDVLHEYQGILQGAPYVKLSIKENVGVDALQQEVIHMLGQVKLVLDAMATVNNGNN